jgi:hypothetical protein
LKLSHVTAGPGTCSPCMKCRGALQLPNKVTLCILNHVRTSAGEYSGAHSGVNRCFYTHCRRSPCQSRGNCGIAPVNGVAQGGLHSCTCVAMGMDSLDPDIGYDFFFLFFFSVPFIITIVQSFDLYSSLSIGSDSCQLTNFPQSGGGVIECFVCLFVCVCVCVCRQPFTGSPHLPWPCPRHLHNNVLSMVFVSLVFDIAMIEKIADPIIHQSCTLTMIWFFLPVRSTHMVSSMVCANVTRNSGSVTRSLFKYTPP